MSPAQAEHLDVAELLALLARIPPAALESHPAGLVHASRILRIATRFDESNDLLSRARRAGEALGDEVLLRSVDAEEGSELVRQLRRGDAEALARGVLATAYPRGGDDAGPRPAGARHVAVLA